MNSNALTTFQTSTPRHFYSHSILDPYCDYICPAAGGIRKWVFLFYWQNDFSWHDQKLMYVIEWSSDGAIKMSEWLSTLQVYKKVSEKQQPRLMVVLAVGVYWVLRQKFQNGLKAFLVRETNFKGKKLFHAEPAQRWSSLRNKMEMCIIGWVWSVYPSNVGCTCIYTYT
jgi:hypothetical protein